MGAGAAAWLVVIAALVALVLVPRLARERRREKLIEAPGPVKAYGVDRSMAIVELGALSRSQGLALLEERYAFAGTFFDSSEEAMAGTRIGFQRSDDHFIEIDLIDSALIMIRAGLGITDGRNEEIVELGDIQAVRDTVIAYFDRSRDFSDFWRGFQQRKACR